MRSCSTYNAVVNLKEQEMIRKVTTTMQSKVIQDGLLNAPHNESTFDCLWMSYPVC